MRSGLMLFLLLCFSQIKAQIQSPPMIVCKDKVQYQTTEIHDYLEFSEGNRILMIQEDGILIVNQLRGDGYVVYGDMGKTSDIPPKLIFRNCEEPVTGVVNVMTGIVVEYDCTLTTPEYNWNDLQWKKELDVEVYDIKGINLTLWQNIKYKDLFHRYDLANQVLFIKFVGYNHVEKKVITK